MKAKTVYIVKNGIEISDVAWSLCMVASVDRVSLISLSIWFHVYFLLKSTASIWLTVIRQDTVAGRKIDKTRVTRSAQHVFLLINVTNALETQRLQISDLQITFDTAI